MLDKIRAIGEYIRNNNVGTELKDRFTNVLQGYKAKLANSARAGMGSSGAQNLTSSPVHKTAMSAIMKYKGRPASADARENKISAQRNSEDERMDEGRMMRQRNQEDIKDYQGKALNQF